MTFVSICGWARWYAAALAAGAFCVAGGTDVASATPAPAVLWVEQGNPSCSDALTRDQVGRARPWCTLQHAAEVARAGDTVEVRPGRYRGTLRPAASGSASAPIRFVAASDRVVIDAAGAAVGLNVIGVRWVSFDGFAVTGAAGQGVFVSDSASVTFSRLKVHGNGTYGIQVRGSALRVSGSTVSGNGMAGISELQSARGNVYEENSITGNGRDGRLFNGDGIQLNGEGAVVRGNSINGNGDPGIYEHGIYAGPTSSGYVIESNVLTGNAGSDVKAAGSGGIVRFNRLADSRIGLVFSDNAQTVSAYDNLIVGKFQHAVMFTTGALPARARLWANTIVQTGSTSVGDASTVFVNAATLADIRNNVICSVGRDGGAVLFLKDGSRATLVSGTNWLCGGDRRGRSLVFEGTRMALRDWRLATGQDRNSLVSPPADFDADFRVVSANLGARLGQPLGLDRDYAGVAVSTPKPDIGAYQSSG